MEESRESVHGQTEDDLSVVVGFLGDLNLGGENHL